MSPSLWQEWKAETFLDKICRGYTLYRRLEICKDVTLIFSGLKITRRTTGVKRNHFITRVFIIHLNLLIFNILILDWIGSLFQQIYLTSSLHLPTLLHYHFMALSLYCFIPLLLNQFIDLSLYCCLYCFISLLHYLFIALSLDYFISFLLYLCIPISLNFNISLFQYLWIPISLYSNISKFQYPNIPIWQSSSISMSQYVNVSIP